MKNIATTLKTVSSLTLPEMEIVSWDSKAELENIFSAFSKSRRKLMTQYAERLIRFAETSTDLTPNAFIVCPYASFIILALLDANNEWIEVSFEGKTRVSDAPVTGKHGHTDSLDDRIFCYTIANYKFVQKEHIPLTTSVVELDDVLVQKTDTAIQFYQVTEVKNGLDITLRPIAHESAIKDSVRHSVPLLGVFTGDILSRQQNRFGGVRIAKNIKADVLPYERIGGVKLFQASLTHTTHPRQQ